MVVDDRVYAARATRRDAIRQGWDQYQAQGWKAQPPYAEQDPRWHFWMNGLDGAAKHQKNLSFEMHHVPGWR